MDFSKRQRVLRKHLAGLAFVVLFHVAIVYALVTGLGKKVIEVAIQPIEIKVIREVRKPPPPPQIVIAPPPKLEAPPPPFIPPPEVRITAPPPPVPVIIAVAPPPPPAPVVIAPAPPPVVAAPPAPVPAPAPAPPAPPPSPPPAPPAPPPPKPAPAGPLLAGVACSKMPPPEPPAVNFEVQGSVFVLATLKNGRVVQVEFERDTLRSVNARTRRGFRDAIEAVMKDGYVCSGDAVQIRQEFYFDIK